MLASYTADLMAAMASSRAPLVAMVVLVVSVFVGGAEAGFLSRSNNITVVGSVYCDACSNNTFSKHSFFLKGEQSMLPACLLPLCFNIVLFCIGVVCSGMECAT